MNGVYFIAALAILAGFSPLWIAWVRGRKV